MMPAAQQDEITELCLTAVCPVVYMMGIDIVRMRTTGKAAASVPSQKSPPQWTGDNSGFASYIEWFSLGAHRVTDQRRIVY
jgi:hypothetical protein